MAYYLEKAKSNGGGIEKLARVFSKFEDAVTYSKDQADFDERIGNKVIYHVYSDTMEKKVCLFSTKFVGELSKKCEKCDLIATSESGGKYCVAHHLYGSDSKCAWCFVQDVKLIDSKHGTLCEECTEYAKDKNMVAKCDWCDALTCKKGTGLLCEECYLTTNDDVLFKLYRTDTKKRECDRCMKDVCAYGDGTLCNDHWLSLSLKERNDIYTKHFKQEVKETPKPINWNFLAKMFN